MKTMDERITALEKQVAEDRALRVAQMCIDAAKNISESLNKQEISNWVCYYHYGNGVEVEVRVNAKDLSEARDKSEAKIVDGWMFEYADEL